MLNSLEVIILAGGMGSRLKSVLPHTPKAMAFINGKPFLQYVLLYLKKWGLTNFRISCGDGFRDIESFFHDGSAYDVQINYCIEEQPLGTGGAIKKSVLQSTKDNFLVVNGDTLFFCDVSLFLQHGEGPLTLGVNKVPCSSRYGNIAFTSDCWLKGFSEKTSISKENGFINSGFYFMTKNIIDYFPENIFSFERDFLEKAPMRIKVVPLEGFFIDIGTPETFRQAQILPQFM